jgi:hypothetical protein
VRFRTESVAASDEPLRGKWPCVTIALASFIGDVDGVDRHDGALGLPERLVAPEHHMLGSEHVEREFERRRPDADRVGLEPLHVLARAHAERPHRAVIARRLAVERTEDVGKEVSGVDEVEPEDGCRTNSPPKISLAQRLTCRTGSRASW